jgi:hypothetical protein
MGGTRKNARKSFANKQVRMGERKRILLTRT